MKGLKESIQQAPVGVLLVNLGSPAEPTPSAVEAFLEEFLSDPLVVDWPRWLWQPIRRTFILPRRSKTVAHLYAEIWTSGGSPITAYTARQAKMLSGVLGLPWRVQWAMRYGQPSIALGLEDLVRKGCERIVVLPLFPQSSRTTTGTVLLEATSAAARMNPVPQLLPVNAYPAHPAFVMAWVERIQETLARANSPAPHVVFSFHGLPERYIRRGDPYRDHCEATAKAIGQGLHLRPGGWTMAYQSKFGPERWLGPSTVDVVARLARTQPSLVVAAPAFVSDCLETLEELGARLRQTFVANGGQEFLLVPCLNDFPTWIAALAELVLEASPPKAVR